MPRMVVFRSHFRGDALLQKGEEFEASEEEAHAYASRKNPLAGVLEPDEPPAPKRARKAAAPTTTKSAKGAKRKK